MGRCRSRLLPADLPRIGYVLVERIVVQEEALEVRIRPQGLTRLIGMLRQGERRAA
jgi:hypothetical protein